MCSNFSFWEKLSVIIVLPPPSFLVLLSNLYRQPIRFFYSFGSTKEIWGNKENKKSRVFHKVCYWHMREKKLEGVWGNKENSWVLQRVLPFLNPTIIVSYFIDFILLKTSILPFLSAPFTGEWTTFVWILSGELHVMGSMG